jgi:hypothetical protein
MLFIMANRKSRLDLHVEKTEGFVNYLLKRRHDSIQKSMLRPLYQEALKCLFLVVVLLIDTLIPMQILLDLPDIINIVTALVVLIIFLYIQKRIYDMLWGKNGRWSLEKYKKTSENIKKETI